MTPTSMPQQALHAAFLPLADAPAVQAALWRAGLVEAGTQAQCLSLQFKAFRRETAWSQARARVCYRLAKPSSAADAESDEQILQGWAHFAHASASAPANEAPLQASLGPLKLDLWRCPEDDALPGLAPLWTLPHGDSGTARPCLVSYRPGTRAVLRYAPHDETPTTFAKTFACADLARRVHERSRRIHAAGGEVFSSAPPLALDATHAAVWHLGAPGTTLPHTLDQGFEDALARRLAQALVILHGLQHDALPRLLAHEQSEDAAKKLDRLMAVRPAIADEFLALRDAIADGIGSATTRPCVTLHGDFHLRQWLREDDRLTLCDFDELCLGAPEVDVASLLMDLSLYGMARPDLRAWSSGLAGEYAVHAPWGLDLPTLRWQLRVQAVNKMHRAWVQLHPDLSGQCQHYFDHLNLTLSTLQS